MIEFQQNAMFSSWIQEIVKYPSFLNDLQPTEYQVEKFLDFIQSNIASMEYEVMNLIVDNPTWRYIAFPPNGITSKESVFYYPQLEELREVKKTVLDWKESKGRIKANSISECIDIFLATGESSYLVTSENKPVQAPEIPETTVDTPITPKAPESPEKPKKLKGRTYALAYILEMRATGKEKDIPFGKSTELQEIGEMRIEEATKRGIKGISPNTFYKNVNRLISSDTWDREAYKKEAGNDWEKKVLQIIDEEKREIVKEYIQTNIL